MKTYKSPSIVSYGCQDILEIIGPAQSGYVDMDVGGGWKEAKLLKPQDDTFGDAGIESIDKAIG